MTMRNNLYNEDVEITPDLDVILKRCFVNHLLVYNQALSFLHKNDELTFKDLKKQIVKYIAEKKLAPVIEIALFNEIYYQYKKFKRNVKIQKLITDIQYFTFLCKGYTGRSLIVSDDRMKITFEGFAGEIQLKKELPVMAADDPVYVNLSFSNIENKYRMSIYKSSN